MKDSHHESRSIPRTKDSSIGFKRILCYIALFLVAFLYFSKYPIFVQDAHINNRPYPDEMINQNNQKGVHAIYVLAGSVKMLDNGNVVAGI